ncbi:toxin HipA, partial [Rhodoferax lacus]
SLSIWSNGARVGEWTIPARGDMQLQYDKAWVQSRLGRPLSLSLPFNLENQPHKGEKVLNYFDNLLPDSEASSSRGGKTYRQTRDSVQVLWYMEKRSTLGAMQ